MVKPTKTPSSGKPAKPYPNFPLFPQVVAVAQLREPALFRSLTEALQSADYHILLVGDAPRTIAQLLAGQADQTPVVTLPELGGGRLVASLQPVDPLANRASS